MYKMVSRRQRHAAHLSRSLHSSDRIKELYSRPEELTRPQIQTARAYVRRDSASRYKRYCLFGRYSDTHLVGNRFTSRREQIRGKTTGMVSHTRVRSGSTPILLMMGRGWSQSLAEAFGAIQCGTQKGQVHLRFAQGLIDTQ